MNKTYTAAKYIKEKDYFDCSGAWVYERFCEDNPSVCNKFTVSDIHNGMRFLRKHPHVTFSTAPIEAVSKITQQKKEDAPVDFALEVAKRGLQFSKDQRQSVLKLIESVWNVA